MRDNASLSVRPPNKALHPTAAIEK
jgi:hypothetical protein